MQKKKHWNQLLLTCPTAIQKQNKKVYQYVKCNKKSVSLPHVQKTGITRYYHAKKKKKTPKTFRHEHHTATDTHAQTRLSHNNVPHPPPTKNLYKLLITAINRPVVHRTSMEHQHSEAGAEGDEWRIFGRRVPKQEAVFISQVILIYMVVITCIFNLSLTSENSNLWTALLSSSIGYLLPNPSIKNGRQRAPVTSLTATPTIHHRHATST